MVEFAGAKAEACNTVVYADGGVPVYVCEGIGRGEGCGGVSERCDAVVRGGGGGGLDNRLTPQREHLVVTGGRFIRRGAISLPTLFRGREVACLVKWGASLLRAGRSKLSPNRRRFGTIFEAALGLLILVGALRNVFFSRDGGG